MAALNHVPEAFAGQIVRKIGHGGEATVYELTGNRVLRLFHAPPVPLDALARFYDTLRSAGAPFALPYIEEYGEREGRAYAIEPLLAGRSLMDALPSLAGQARAAALDAFARTAAQIAKLPLEASSFGELLAPDPLRCATWPAFLRAAVDRQLAHMGEALRSDVPRLDGIVDALNRRIDALSPVDRPKLVHGDYFPGNVLVDDAGLVTAVIDFGALTLAGDPRMDLAAAAIFLEVQRRFEPGDATYVIARLLEDHGEDLRDAIATYRAWYAIRLSHSKYADERLYAWCVRTLNAMPEP